MQAVTIRVKDSLLRGVRSGLRTGFWMTKMMLPITFVVAILKWSGAVAVMTEWLTPLFKYIGLTGEGVLVFLTSIFASLYAAIAVIATLDLDYRSVAILSVMGLICHNLIVETIIQRKAGASALYIILLRIGAALIAAALLNWIMPDGLTGTLIIEHAVAESSGLSGALYDWMLSMVRLLPIMFALILSLNMLQQLLREFRLVELLTIPIRPLIRAMGLPRDSSFLWIVMNSLGLAYGGAVLIADVENSEISRRSARLLNTHVAITHSLIEDTLLFAAIGIGLGWLVIPRLLLSVVAVWIERGVERMRA